MATFFYRAKYSASAITGMVANPQDREGPIKSIAKSCGLEIESAYFSADTAEVMGFATGSSSAKNAFFLMAYASGAIDRDGSECVEVTDAKAFQACMRKASKVIGSYKVAGSSD